MLESRVVALFERVDRFEFAARVKLERGGVLLGVFSVGGVVLDVVVVRVVFGYRV